MQDKPRYSRLLDILDLAIFMYSKLQGITIKNIENAIMFPTAPQNVCVTA